MKEYSFVDKKNLTNIYHVQEIYDQPEIAYFYFMNHEDTIIYVIEEEKLLGIISFGDLERYYKSERKIFTYNKNFSFLSEKNDFRSAEVIFNKFKSIFEIPVISENEFIGVIRFKDKCGGRVFEEKIKNLCLCKYFGEDADYMEWGRAFHKLKNANKVILYNIPTNEETAKYILDMEERNRLIERNETYESSLSDKEKKFFWKTEKWNEYDKLCRESLSQLEVIEENGIRGWRNIKNRFFDIKNGRRKTLQNNIETNARIFLFGPCIVFGAYVENDDTIASYLQKKINDEGLGYKVINSGFPSASLSQIYREGFSKNDLAIIMEFLPPCVDQLTISNCSYGTDLRTVFSKGECSVYDFLQQFAHCNKKMNYAISEVIYKDIYDYLTDKNKSEDISYVPGDNYYISSDVYYYFGRYFDKYMLVRNNTDKNIGSIVMNCNPFTFGHRYLIEYAASKADELYVFVVEEDKSFFKFDDRMKMVLSGTKDIPNVHVLPSGKYIISQATFSQYFEKENVSYVESMDYDVRIFSEVVASYLGIKCRFVGEEIQDQVTKQYNCTLKRILPEYKIDLIEIPRKTLADGEVISATTVRRLLKEKKYKELERYCPKTTLDILQSEYIHA